ncbi:hypothetical protein ES705_30502 [subsurface metagenome]
MKTLKVVGIIVLSSPSSYPKPLFPKLQDDASYPKLRQLVPISVSGTIYRHSSPMSMRV